MSSDSAEISRGRAGPLEGAGSSDASRIGWTCMLAGAAVLRKAAGPRGASPERDPATSESSGATVDRDAQGIADLDHTTIGEPSEALDEHPDGDALHRIEVDRGAQRD